MLSLYTKILVVIILQMSSFHTQDTNTYPRIYNTTILNTFVNIHILSC